MLLRMDSRYESWIFRIMGRSHQSELCSLSQESKARLTMCSERCMRAPTARVGSRETQDLSRKVRIVGATIRRVTRSAAEGVEVQLSENRYRLCGWLLIRR